MDDIEVLADLFAVWAETGSINEAIVEAEETTDKYIVREAEESESED